MSSSDLNKFIGIGRVVRDVDFKTTDSGKSVCNFSIASNGYGDQVSFFNCVSWQKTAELISQYVKKGDRVGIEGRLGQRTWEDTNNNKRSTIEIIVEKIQFLTPKSGSSEQSETAGKVVSNFDDTSPFSEEDVEF